jgi:endosialidase-like protein
MGMVGDKQHDSCSDFGDKSIAGEMFMKRMTPFFFFLVALFLALPAHAQQATWVWWGTDQNHAVPVSAAHPLPVTGISGGSLTITDGAHTVTGTTTLTFSGAVVSGTTPNGTATISGSGMAVDGSNATAPAFTNIVSASTGNVAGTPTISGNWTWNGDITFGSSGLLSLPADVLVMQGSSTGTTQFQSANASATSYTLIFPAANDTLADLAGTQTLTNKTIAYASNTLTGVAPTVGDSAIVTVGALASGSIASGFGSILTTNTITGASFIPTSTTAPTDGLSLSALATHTPTITANGVQVAQFNGNLSIGQILVGTGAAQQNTGDLLALAPSGGRSGILGMTIANGSANAAASVDFYLANNATNVFQILCNSSANTSGNGASSCSMTASTSLFLQGGNTNAIGISSAGVPTLYYQGTQALTFGASENATFAGGITAASLATSGTIGGAICSTSAGILLYNAGANCYAGSGGVSSFSAGTTGFTPSTATTGAVTLAGTLGPANGGTGSANNAANTITFSGNFGLTLTLSNTTSVTLPTAGTLAILGANTFTGNQTISAAQWGLSGNLSVAAIGTGGARIVNVAGNITDTGDSGTVTAGYTDVWGGNTILASSATTFTNYFASYVKTPIASTNVTFTHSYALGADSAAFGTSQGLTISTGGNLSGATLTGTEFAMTAPTVNTAMETLTGGSLTGSNATTLFNYAATANTTGVETIWQLAVTNTASGAGALLMNLLAGSGGATSEFKVDMSGNVTAGTFIPTGTSAPANGMYYSSGNGPWITCGSVTCLVTLKNSQTGLGLIGNNAGAINTYDTLTFSLSASHILNASFQNTSANSAAGEALYIGNNTSASEFSIILNSSANTGGNGDNSATINGAAGLWLQGGGTNALVVTSGQLVELPAIATDATHTDNTICEDDTTHALYAGSGTAGICLGTSAMRFKTDVHTLAPGLPEIMQMRAVDYRYLPQYGGPGVKYGFIADEVEKVMPQLVGLNDQDQPTTLDYMGVVPVAVHAIQEQQIEIERLKAKVAELRRTR